MCLQNDLNKFNLISNTLRVSKFLDDKWSKLILGTPNLFVSETRFYQNTLKNFKMD